MVAGSDPKFVGRIPYLSFPWLASLILRFRDPVVMPWSTRDVQASNDESTPLLRERSNRENGGAGT